MKRGYLAESQYWYLAGCWASHREWLRERGVDATDTVPLQKMIYVAAFQGGIEKFVTHFENTSQPLDGFISARTLAPKQRDPQLLKKILGLEPPWEKPETRHACVPLFFIHDLIVAMENRAALMYVSGIPKVEDVQRHLPPDVALPICTILSAITRADELLPAPSLTVNQNVIGRFKDLLNSDVFHRYSSAHERIEFEAHKSTFANIRRRGAELLRAGEGVLTSRRVSMNIISVVPKIVDTAFGKLPGALAQLAGELATNFVRDQQNVLIYQFDDWVNEYTTSNRAHLLSRFSVPF